MSETEFTDMPLVALVTRALLYGSNNDAILREAERRKLNAELTAIGKRPGPEWTPVAAIAWPPVEGFEGMEMAICWRQKAKESK